MEKKLPYSYLTGPFRSFSMLVLFGYAVMVLNPAWFMRLSLSELTDVINFAAKGCLGQKGTPGAS